ncbi:MAG: prepilin-type N-terminal cleavage/methylation domain-containing protein [Candidatus Hydrogenedentes bacterium]|nr:prepilin-type N-terminal cleavage/methylation domain-containing protein [Candidatus Hydrogenedentota bacterium]
MKSQGYSLVEVMMASSVLGVVSLLGFVVLMSSTESAQLTTAKVDVQNNLRDTMSVITSELREAVTTETTELTGAPEDLAAVLVEGGGLNIIFQVPEPTAGEALFSYSTPISFTLEYEDENGNGRLDDGEDSNGDGVLTRRIVRIQDGATTAVASANSLDSVLFTLVENQAAGNTNLTTVNIVLTGSKRYGPGDGKLVRSEMEADIRLVN